MLDVKAEASEIAYVLRPHEEQARLIESLCDEVKRESISLLAKERDEFGKRETELLAEVEKLRSLSEVQAISEILAENRELEAAVEKLKKEREAFRKVALSYLGGIAERIAPTELCTKKSMPRPRRSGRRGQKANEENSIHVFAPELANTESSLSRSER